MVTPQAVGAGWAVMTLQGAGLVVHLGVGLVGHLRLKLPGLQLRQPLETTAHEAGLVGDLVVVRVGLGVALEGVPVLT